jgi:hypothetical protein
MPGAAQVAPGALRCPRGDMEFAIHPVWNSRISAAPFEK